MPLVSTPAIVLATFRYGETSKIVRLATRDHGVQSAIAKGALRPRSRFGAALQVLSSGTAHILLSERRDLHTLTAFDLAAIPVGIARDLRRYATAAAMAEVMLRFAPAESHPEGFALFLTALTELESVEAEALPAVSLRALWSLVGTLGFAPVLNGCVRDGRALPVEGDLHFSVQEGGALCAGCARGGEATRLPAEARASLEMLLGERPGLPTLDQRHAAAHRRLLARYIAHHLGEGTSLPALEFWHDRAWGLP